MADILNLSRPGQQDGAGDADAMFLKVYGGEVLTAFTEKNITMNRHMTRMISSGKSATFPATWKVDARYHTPGQAIQGNQSVKHNERVIFVDDLLISDVFVSEIDELKNHYDVRAEYSKQTGAALAKRFDKNILQVGVLASRAAATVTGGFGGAEVVNAAAKTDGEVLAGMIFDAAQTMDEKDVPDDERYCYLKPAQYYLLYQTPKVMNRDWGGKGSYATAKGLVIADVEILKTNNLPTTNIAAAIDGEKNTYYGDFSGTAGLVQHRSAVGTVKMMDLTVMKTADRGDFYVMYQGVLILAKYLMGHGILRPESGVELRTASL